MESRLQPAKLSNVPWTTFEQVISARAIPGMESRLQPAKLSNVPWTKFKRVVTEVVILMISAPIPTKVVRTRMPGDFSGTTGHICNPIPGTPVSGYLRASLSGSGKTHKCRQPSIR
jgi:hypothetical protein